MAVPPGKARLVHVLDGDHSSGHALNSLDDIGIWTCRPFLPTRYGRAGMLSANSQQSRQLMQRQSPILPPRTQIHIAIPAIYPLIYRNKCDALVKSVKRAN